MQRDCLIQHNDRKHTQEVPAWHLFYGKATLQQIFTKLKELGFARFFQSLGKRVSHQAARAFASGSES